LTSELNTSNSFLHGNVKNFKVFIGGLFKKIDGDYTGLDITDMVVEISMLESIFSPVIYGQMQIVDSMGLFSMLPIVGQEHLLVRWTREDKIYEKMFYTTDVNSVARLTESVGTYMVKFSTPTHFLNIISNFSCSYKNRTAGEIIEDIVFKKLTLENNAFENLDSAIDKRSDTFEKICVVFPYMKPLGAIDLIINNLMGTKDGIKDIENRSPFLFYESLYGNKLILDTYGEMLKKEPLIFEQKSSNKDELTMKIMTNNINDNNYAAVSSFAFNESYRMLEAVGGGAFGSLATYIDPCVHGFKIKRFDYREHASIKNGDTEVINQWVSDSFKIHTPFLGKELQLHEIYSTRNILNFQNRYAFRNPGDSSDVIGINGHEEWGQLDRNIIQSYKIRMTNTVLTLNMDPSVLIEPGNIIKVLFESFSPKIEGSEEYVKDKITSGKYMVSAIRHIFKNKQYTMTLELSRPGIGEEANYYGENDPIWNTPEDIDLVIT
jgi:hypothetical protein